MMMKKGYGEILEICDSVLGKSEIETKSDEEIFSLTDDEFEEKDEQNFPSKLDRIIIGEPREQKIETIGPIKRTDERSLNKSLKMLLNKLSDKNMIILIQEFKNMVKEYGINTSLSEFASCFIECTVQPTLLPDRILLIYSTFLSCLHMTNSNEFLLSFLQVLVNNFNINFSSFDANSSDKKCQNCIVILCILFYLNNIGFILIRDLIEKFIADLSEVNVEMVLLILKYCGFEIRKRETQYLKNFIQAIHSKIKLQSSVSLRTAFMLDTITAIQHNNPSKVTNYDPVLFESFVKIKREVLKNYPCSEATVVDISLSVLSHSGESLKWSFSNISNVESEIKVKKSENLQKWDPDLLNVAHEQRYKDPLKIDIFCTLMTSESSMDAFRRLKALNLKSKQQQSIIRISIETCLQETSYNPYYFEVVKEFASSHRTFSSTLQFCIWDQLRKLSDLTHFNQTNLTQLLLNLFISKSVEFKIFKIVDFNSLGSVEKEFYLDLISQVILKCSTDVLKSLFEKISNEKWLFLRDNIVFFLISNLHSDSKVIQRVKLESFAASQC